MSIIRFISCVGIWLFLLYGKGHAQENQLISGQFDHATFAEFVSSIERQTDLRFFYDETLLDSFFVSGSFIQIPVKKALDEIFELTDYTYAFHRKNVFITQTAAIQTSIPDSYFERINDREAPTNSAILDFLQPVEEDDDKQKAEVITIGQASRQIKGRQVILTGKIKDVYTGEPIIGALVKHEASQSGAISDVLGNYRISLPSGRVQLEVSSVLMLPSKVELLLYEDGKLDIELKEAVANLKEVVIEAEKGANVAETQMGREKIEIQALKQLPTLLGEVDVLSAIKTLPGVQSSGENSTGLNVRGGSAGQNLILFNEAPIYNSAHLFGFFSVFNPEVIKEVELYKSGIPAEYGGRISSVLEVNSKDGNKKQFAGSGGIGLISGRLALEGPIIKDKMSILVSGRSTYSDWLLKRIPNEEIAGTNASFYDLHTRLAYEIDNKNSLSISSYYSDDQFSFGDDTAYQYSNFNTMLQWKRVFNDKLFGEFTGGF
ncbi:MAG: TonB-dependent receptor plug domain-containing protein, partial [Bacteroidetes bacterium]|nr:TonB-dependent receptor plug domain-containing protein [Bacteroidota bacterium]